MRGILNFLVIGECGDGKSTLINSLRDTQRSEVPKQGKNARGVTKSITPYCGKPIGDQQTVYFDSPGIGDKDITAMKLIAAITEFLTTSKIQLDGVLVTNQIPDARMRMGAQVVQILVNEGFVGKEKWDNVILVGTKMDKGDEDESGESDLECFRTSVVPLFFAQNGGVGKFACVSSKSGAGMPDFLLMMGKLPHCGITFSRDAQEKMCGEMAGVMGIDTEVFTQGLQDEIEGLREKLEQEKQRTGKGFWETIGEGLVTAVAYFGVPFSGGASLLLLDD
jgi:GTP-binding protein EngB required for normal cell division